MKRASQVFLFLTNTHDVVSTDCWLLVHASGAPEDGDSLAAQEVRIGSREWTQRAMQYVLCLCVQPYPRSD